MVRQAMWMAVVLASCSTLPADEKSPMELLKTWETSQNWMRRLAVQGESRIQVFRPGEASPMRNRQLGELRIDGDKLDLLLNNWSNLDETTQDAPRPERPVARHIWDGSSYYSINFPQFTQGKRIGFVCVDAKPPTEMASMFNGSPLMLGQFPGDGQSFSVIMRRAVAVSLRPGTEEIDGVKCHIVEAATSSGSYAVWLSPERGYNVVRAEVQRQADDLYYGMPVKDTYPQTRPAALPADARWERHPQLASVSFLLSGVKFDQIGGAWTPKEATWEIVQRDAQGGTELDVIHFRVEHISLDPDFAAMGAFVPDVPDGTKVFVEGQPTILYVWRGGKPVVDAENR